MSIGRGLKGRKNENEKTLTVGYGDWIVIKGVNYETKNTK
jgi:hypothetical protein